jgi:hypothetical protein
MVNVLEPHTARRRGIRENGKRKGKDNGWSDVHPELTVGPLTNGANPPENAENWADSTSFITATDVQLEV